MEYKDLKKELKQYQYEFDLLQNVPCTKEEIKEYTNLQNSGRPLPENVTWDEMYGYRKTVATDLTEDEIKQYLAYKQAKNIRTIKNCMVFFTILTVVGLILWLFSFIFSAVTLL